MNREEGIGKKSVALATESPRLGVAEAPPFDKGGFGLHIHCHRSNDTGRVREVTIRRKLPCENVSGHCPLIG